MKKTMLTILIAGGILLCKAQGHYEGQMATGVNYLFTPRGNAYNFNVQKLIGANYFGFRTDITYTDQKNDLNVVVKEEVPHQIYSVGASATYSLEKVITHPFYLQLFLGPSYNYEVLNNNKEQDSKGVPYKKPNNHTFGVYGGAELEFSINQRISLVATSLNSVPLNSEVNNYNLAYGLGLKLNF